MSTTPEQSKRDAKCDCETCKRNAEITRLCALLPEEDGKALDRLWNIVFDEASEADMDMAYNKEQIVTLRLEREAEVKKLKERADYLSDALQKSAYDAKEMLELRQQNDLLRTENAALREALKITAIRAFNIGCLHGHEETVEGRFTIIMPQDIPTYNADLVNEMLRDTSLPEATRLLTAPPTGGEGKGV